jgi:beta-phosphoglucomutase
MTNIKAIIFDMDGVLIDARDWHYRALNEALSYFGSEISYEDHLERFNGLPTKVKLAMLSEEGLLPNHVHPIVEAVKQERTLREAATLCFPKIEHQILLGWLRAKGFKLAVGTNSIRETSTAMLTFAGVLPLLDALVTNQDVNRGKPEPDIYLKACSLLSIKPHEALVVEDHPTGAAAARAAGCKVVMVDGPEQVNLGLIREHLSED